MKKKLFAAFLALVMIVSLCSFTASADMIEEEHIHEEALELESAGMREYCTYCGSSNLSFSSYGDGTHLATCNDCSIDEEGTCWGATPPSCYVGSYCKCGYLICDPYGHSFRYMWIDDDYHGIYCIRRTCEYYADDIDDDTFYYYESHNFTSYTYGDTYDLGGWGVRHFRTAYCNECGAEAEQWVYCRFNSLNCSDVNGCWDLY